MKFEFDRQTGFLITKVILGMTSKDNSRADKKEQNIVINNNIKAPENGVKSRRSAKTSIPLQKNHGKNASPKQYSNYQIPYNAIETTGTIVGGELFRAISELGTAIATPLRMIGGLKSAIGKYRDKKKQKEAEEAYFSDLEVQDKQSDTLDEILKEIKKGDTPSKSGLLTGVGSRHGAISSFLFKGGIKGLLKRLGIAGMIYSVFDGYGAEIQKIADSQGVDVDEVGISDKLHATINGAGHGVVKFLNLLGADLDPSKIDAWTQEARSGVKNTLANIEDNYPTFGKALNGTLDAVDGALGKATTYLENAMKVLLDAGRKKTDKEKEFIEAQDTVGTYDRYGVVSFHTKEERDKAYEKMQELAPDLLKDEKFVKNSPYAKVAKKAISKKYNQEIVVSEKKRKREEIEQRIQKEREEVRAMEEHKKGYDNGDFSSIIKRKALYSSDKAFEEELKKKKALLAQHEKLLQTTTEIVREAEKQLKEIKDNETVGSTREEPAIGNERSSKYVDIGNKLWKTSTMEYEGFRDHVYKDSKGYSTIGYGHKLTKQEIKSGKYKNGISKEDAKKLYATDKAKHNKKLYNTFGWVKDQPQQVREALEDMAYNMGVGDGKHGGLSGFKKTLSLIKAGKYKEASKGMLNSQYAKDVGLRAVDNSIRIASAEPTSKSIDIIQKSKVATTAKAKKPTQYMTEAKRQAQDTKANRKDNGTTATATATIDITPIAQAVKEGQAMVAKEVSKITKNATKTTKAETVIQVNIQNKSTQQNIEGLI